MSLNLDKSFNFNRGHRRAIFILSALVAALIMYRYFMKINPEENYNNAEILRKVENFIANQDTLTTKNHGRYKSKSHKRKPKVNLRPFNPNIMSTDGLLSLGLSEKQANTIQNYVSAGGEFRFKEDLKKIYCISNNDYARLEPFILLEERPNHFVDNITADNEIVIPIELNAAQMEDLLSVRGIGPFTAKNILKYRNQLGGFYCVQQLKEVYGLDSAKYEDIYYHFEINQDSIHRINLNTADYYNLKKHPYLSKNIAFSISNHSKYEKTFESVEELKTLNSINDSIYQKIYHYFVVY